MRTYLKGRKWAKGKSRINGQWLITVVHRIHPLHTW